MAYQYDAEAQAEFATEQSSEARALLPEESATSRPVGARRAVGGLLAAGVGVCAAGFCAAVATGHAAAPWQAAPPAPRLTAVDGLIQDNAWTSCDVDWVIKEKLLSNLGGSDPELPKGMIYKVERHGGGLETAHFQLDVKAPTINEGDRSGDGHAEGSLKKLHLEHGHPLNLHFTLWDEDHKEQLTMTNFGIGFYDLDKSKKGGHHEYVVAEPSMVARVGASLEMTTLESGKMRFEGQEFGLGEDNNDHTATLTESQERKAVRLLYNNVDEFVVSVGWTNPDHGIPREVAFSLHDPMNCKDPVAAPASEEAAEVMEDEVAADVAEAKAAEAKADLKAFKSKKASAERAAKNWENRAKKEEAELDKLEDKTEAAVEHIHNRMETFEKKEAEAQREITDAKQDIEEAKKERKDSLKVMHKAQAEAKKEHAQANAREGAADCAEGEAEAQKKMRIHQKHELKEMEEKLDDFIDAKPAHCKDCD